MQEEGDRPLAADSPQSLVDDPPTARLVRQVLGAIGGIGAGDAYRQAEGTRGRKSARAGRRVEGRKRFAITNPKAAALAKRLRRASPKTGERRSLRDISALLGEAGHLNEHGRRFSPRAIKAMVES